MCDHVFQPLTCDHHCVRTTVNLALYESLRRKTRADCTSCRLRSFTADAWGCFLKVLWCVKTNSNRLDKLFWWAGSGVGMDIDIRVTVEERRALKKLLAIVDDASHSLQTVISAQRQTPLSHKSSHYMTVYSAEGEGIAGGVEMRSLHHCSTFNWHE